MVVLQANADDKTAAPKNFTHKELAEKSIIIDLHCDTIYRINKSIENREKKKIKFNYDLNSKALEVSLPKMAAAGVKAQFFALWVSETKKERRNKGYEKTTALKLLEVFHKMMNEHSSAIAFAGSYADLEKNIKNGKISAFLGIEDGAALGDDIQNLDYFFKKGIRYITLTWKHNNLIGDSSTDKKNFGGLSEFGRKVVKRMNELGMLIDISHASDGVVRDALKLSKDPVIASHSDCAGVRPLNRNLKDELIKGVCEKGGVIGVNFHRAYLKRGKSPATVKDVADHIDHLKKTGGIGCVALGSDFDGYITAPLDLENIGQLSILTEELKARKYSRDEIEKIYGQNFLRVLKKVVDKTDSK